MARKIIIFDMDQTLVDLLPLHDAAVSRAFQHVLGFAGKFSEVDFAGRAFDENIQRIARKHGIPDIDPERRKQIAEIYQSQMIEQLPAAKQGILPGAKELVRALHKKKHVLALATGTPAHIADAVLRHTKLRDYFAVVMGGETGHSRDELFRAAKETAERVAGEPLPCVVIGDSSRDIASGKAIGAKTIAVLTGPEPKETVISAKPDIVVEKLDAPDLIKKIEAD